MTVRVHPFPSRTRQLSSLVPTILGWKRPGTIGRCQHKNRPHGFPCGLFFYLQLLVFPAASSAETTELRPTAQIMAAATILRQVQTNAAALGWKRPGTIGRCQHKKELPRLWSGEFLFVSVGFYVLLRFLQTAILITELTYGRMAQVRHSQDAAVGLTVCTDSAPHRAALEQ